MAPARTALRLVGAAAQACQLNRWGARGAWNAVLFHHIADGDAWRADSPFVKGLGVTIDEAAFLDCVRYLAHAYDVVPLAHVLPRESGDRAPNPRSRKRQVVICFDDAYASVVEIAAPALESLGLPWCFFVNPALVGNATLAADNAVTYVANSYGLGALSRAVGRTVHSIGDLIHGHFVQRTPAERRQLVAAILDDVHEDPNALAREAKLYVKPADIRQLADSGVEIGNHTAEHVHCRALTEDSLREQVIASAHAIHDLSGRPVRGFAYPYGNLLDRTELVTSALRSSGHQCAFVVHNRANSRQTDPFGLFRISLNTGDPRLIAAEMEVLPRLRSTKARFASHA